MTVSQHIELATGSGHKTRRIVERLPQAALAAVMFALVMGAWLAFFVFVPIDFRVR
jgi:trans-aconitate methyltransferase